MSLKVGNIFHWSTSTVFLLFVILILQFLVESNGASSNQTKKNSKSGPKFGILDNPISDTISQFDKKSLIKEVKAIDSPITTSRKLDKQGKSVKKSKPKQLKKIRLSKSGDDDLDIDAPATVMDTEVGTASNGFNPIQMITDLVINPLFDGKEGSVDSADFSEALEGLWNVLSSIVQTLWDVGFLPLLDMGSSGWIRIAGLILTIQVIGVIFAMASPILVPIILVFMDGYFAYNAFAYFFYF